LRSLDDIYKKFKGPLFNEIVHRRSGAPGEIWVAHPVDPKSGYISAHLQELLLDSQVGGKLGRDEYVDALETAIDTNVKPLSLEFDGEQINGFATFALQSAQMRDLVLGLGPGGTTCAT
jgi:hypothetical protein